VDGRIACVAGRVNVEFLIGSDPSRGERRVVYNGATAFSPPISCLRTCTVCIPSCSGWGVASNEEFTVNQEEAFYPIGPDWEAACGVPVKEPPAVSVRRRKD
jgi:hypothetical protein